MRSAGLFDIQVNGFAGIDFNSDRLTAAALDKALGAMLATGVTLCLPTLITADAGTLRRRFVALDRAVADSRLGPLMVPGYHLEGPFLNPAPGYRGCHPAEAMIAPDPALVESLGQGLKRPILLVTIAPEIAGAEAFTRWAVGRGIAVACGHSAATPADLARCADAGMTLATHLGNGVLHQQHKFDNPIFAQLAEDRLAASFIADGIHVPKAALKILLRAKGLDRAILVTDAVSAAGAPAGLYDFAGMAIEQKPDGSVRVPGEGGYLAGAGLCLDQAVRNIVAWGLAAPAHAIAMASQHPLAALDAAFRMHGINVPESDVTWSDDLHPLGAVIDGVTLWQTNSNGPMA